MKPTRFHPILALANELQNRKGQDYGSTDNARSNYFPYGHHSYLTMLHTKLERLKNMAEAPAKTENFESAFDSCVDLINYASFYGAYLQELVDDSNKVD